MPGGRRHLRGSARLLLPYAAVGLVWFPLLHGLSHAFLIHPLWLETAGGLVFALGSVLVLRVISERAVATMREANESLESRVEERTRALSAEISERARAEQAARASERRFRDIAEAASDWFWESDPQLRFSYVSDRFAELMGVSVDRILGRSLSEVFAVGGEAVATPFLPELRPFRDLHVRFDGANGVRELLLNGRPAFDQASLFIGYRGTGTDITDQRAARRAAEQLEHLQELILSSLGDGVFGIDNEGAVTFINPAGEAMLGWSAADLIGRPAALTLQCGELDGTAEAGPLRIPSSEGETLVRRCGFRRRDGSLLPVHLVWSPVTEQGEVVGAVAVFRDIGEELRFERELTIAKERAERATQAKSDFLAEISHELRTPLNAIVGFSDIMQSEIFGSLGSDRYRAYVEDIRRSGQHTLDLLNDLLDLSRIEAGRLELFEQPVDVAQVVGEALAMVKPDAAKNSCQLVNNAPGNLPMLKADERRLRQMLLNLLSNAIKFTPAGGRISVTAEVDGEGRLNIRVADTGIGIAAEELPRVTDLFVQGNAAVSRRYEGAGMGLPLAKHLVEMHGGTLRIASGVQAGTTVTLTFPPTRLVTGEPIGPF